MINLNDLPLTLQEKIVRIQDARSYREKNGEESREGCVPGWRSFVESHGFIWKEVVLNGLTVKQLLSLDDVMATSLVKFVLERDHLHG